MKIKELLIDDQIDESYSRISQEIITKITNAVDHSGIKEKLGKISKEDHVSIEVILDILGDFLNDTPVTEECRKTQP